MRNILERPVEQASIRRLRGLAEDLNSEVAAGGLATAAELETVCSPGVNLGPGYLFARPSRECHRSVHYRIDFYARILL